MNERERYVRVEQLVVEIVTARVLDLEPPVSALLEIGSEPLLLAGVMTALVDLSTSLISELATVSGCSVEAVLESLGQYVCETERLNQEP